jgi:hypothetical protein
MDDYFEEGGRVSAISRADFLLKNSNYMRYIIAGIYLFRHEIPENIRKVDYRLRLFFHL